MVSFVRYLLERELSPIGMLPLDMKKAEYRVDMLSCYVIILLLIFKKVRL